MSGIDPARAGPQPSRTQFDLKGRNVKTRKHIIARALILAILTGPLAVIIAAPAHACVQPPEGGIGAQVDCGTTVKAQLSQGTSGGSVRVYGFAYSSGVRGLKLNLAIDIGGKVVFVASEQCPYSSSCTFDHTYPCERDCIETGWYWLQVGAFRLSDGAWIGSASDRTYIQCAA